MKNLPKGEPGSSHSSEYLPTPLKSTRCFLPRFILFPLCVCGSSVSSIRLPWQQTLVAHPSPNLNFSETKQSSGFQAVFTRLLGDSSNHAFKLPNVWCTFRLLLRCLFSHSDKNKEQRAQIQSNICNSAPSEAPGTLTLAARAFFRLQQVSVISVCTFKFVSV